MDLRQQWRSLRRTPATTAAAIATIAIGIGLAVAVFSVADVVLLQPLPVRDEEQLAVLWGERVGGLANTPMSLTDARRFAEGARTLDAVSTFGFRGASPVAMQYQGQAQSLRASLVEGSYFEVLGARAALGRTFTPDDDRVGAAPVVVLSHRTWRERFGSDSAVVGRALRLVATGAMHTVVGVMPAGLEYPRGTELWVPLRAWSAGAGYLEIATSELDLVARLTPGVTQAQVAGELQAFLARRDAPAWQRELRAVVTPLRESALGRTRSSVQVVSLFAGVLFLLCAVNASTLLLARAIGRSRELGVRAALGATRAHLAWQLLLESAALSSLGGLAGWVLAGACVDLFRWLAPAGLPRADLVRVNATALGVAALLVLVLAAMASLAAMAFATRTDATRVFAPGVGAGISRGTRRAAEGLVSVQAGLAALALAVALVVLTSYVRLHRAPLAFAGGDLTIAELEMPADRNVPATMARIDRIVERLSSTPGVRGATPVLSAPFIGAEGGIDGRLAAPGQDEAARAANPVVNLEVAAPSHFATLGIPILGGRPFDSRDRREGPGVVIVSEAVARHFWPGRSPLGAHLEGFGGKELEVVGVVPDTRYRELETPRASVYLPLEQSPFPVVPRAIVVRHAPGAGVMAPVVREAVAGADSAAVVLRVSDLPTLLEAPRAQPRLNAAVLGAFALACLAIAVVGLLAVMALVVRQRRREIGIRLAVGASPRMMHREIVRRGVAVALPGVLIGAILSLAGAGALESLLFQTSATGVAARVMASAVMLTAAALGSWLPARLGAGVDPLVALRAEG